MTWREFAPATAFRLNGENRGLMYGVVWQVIFLVLSVATLPFDHRTILGINPWIKPIKFELSILIFLLTMAILLSAVGRTGKWARTRKFLGWSFAIAMMVEITIISLQSLRGVRSHMNYATGLDTSLFSIMGGAIGFNTMLVGILLVLYCITKTGLPTALTWGIRLGLLVLLAGSVEGVLIVGHGAHTVGAADGGPGMAFVNWSTDHGDLRVTHFFAIHALQAFMLAGFILSNTRLREQLQTASVFLFAVVYLAVVWRLFMQAMAGQPLLRL